MEITEKKENIAMGILGALLGGLIGGAAIVLFGQLGLISAFSGVILAFCTLKGYELLGGKLTKRGVWVCIVVMLAVPYLADRVSWALVIVKEFQWAFGDAFRYVHDVVEEYELQNDYWKDLLFVYAFAALGAFTILKQTSKQKKED
jgi:hypothetical protein